MRSCVVAFEGFSLQFYGGSCNQLPKALVESALMRRNLSATVLTVVDSDNAERIHRSSERRRIAQKELKALGL